MSEYTPTTAEVREFYSYGCGPRHTWKESQADFDVWLKAHDAEVERAAAEKALREAADAIDDGEDYEAFKNRTEIAPKGWTDGSIHDALDSSGVITDWLRNRAAALGLTAGQEGDS